MDAVPDGVPKNRAIGVGLGADWRDVGRVLLGGVVLGNVCETVGLAVGVRREGRPVVYVLAGWEAVAIARALVTVLGSAVLGALSAAWIGAL